MANKKRKQTLKVALASTIAVTAAAGVVYNTPKIIKTVAVEDLSNKNFVLKAESIDKDTVKLYIDNVNDIPKSLQFTIQLEGVIPKKNENNLVIKDLIKEENSNNVITSYTYNSEDNTIDVLVTSTDGLNKIGNIIEIFELDVEKKSDNTGKEYTIKAENDSKYKYLTTDNKEVENQFISEDKALAINSAPTISKKEDVNYIELNVGDKLSLTDELLREYVIAEDADEGDKLTFEVKDINDKAITEFTTNTAGIYDLYVTANDDFGGKSDTLNLQVKVNELEINPIITRDDKELEDVTINAGEVFNLMDGVKAVDALGNSVDVTVKADKELDLDPNVTTVYNVTYTAIDSIGRETVVTIKLTVKANKAPVIDGYKDYTLTVGDEFDPSVGVTVTDEDEDIKLNIDSNVNTNIPGVYRVIYSATDSGNKTTRVQTVVVVNPKMESMNSIPEITANDVVIQLGEEFKELNGVTANDAEEGDITNKVTVVRNEVVNTIAGKYKVTYSVTDSNGASSTKTITVIVNDPPQINAEDKTIKLGEKFNPLSGVSATDKEDGVITNIEVIETTVDETKEGTYTVTYSVVDSHGGKATKTITVTVKKDVVLAETITINNKINNLYIGSSKILTATIDEKADLKDIEWSTSDENIASIEVIANDVKVIAKSKGQVTITAKTKDGSNKSDTVTIDVLEYKENVEDFISNAIDKVVDTGIVIPVLGSGTAESPLEMEVQNVTVDKFEEFLTKIKDLNPVIADKYVEGNFTVYKIKVENTSILSKIIRLFKASSSEEGYIYLKVANNLDESKAIIDKIDSTIDVEKPEEPSNPGDGSGSEDGDTSNPGDGSGSGSGEGDTSNPGDGSGNEGGTDSSKPETGNGGTSTPDGNNGNQGSTEETITPDKNESEDKKEESNGIKLPITGQESILGYVATAVIAIGGVLFFYKKKK